MKSRSRLWLGLIGFALGVAWGGVPAVQSAPYSLTGNLRLGFGFPSNFLGAVPHTPWPAPTGRVWATANATVQQTLGPDPVKMTFAPNQLTAPAVQRTLPIFLFNAKVFQASTALSAKWPKAAVTFQKAGRLGPATVTWCPGRPLPTPGLNPGCAGPQAGPLGSGLFRYTKTLNQFGGPGVASIGGNAAIHMVISGVAPCDWATGPCLAGVVPATPPASPAAGATFGFSTNAGVGAAPNLFNVRAIANGLITATSVVGTGAGLSNIATSFGAPWTTGKVTVSITDQTGPINEVFILSGSDARVAGVGTISLVSAAVVTRSITGTSANRGWLNLTVPEPSGLLGFSAALALVALLHGVALRRLPGHGG